MSHRASRNLEALIHREGRTVGGKNEPQLGQSKDSPGKSNHKKAKLYASHLALAGDISLPCHLDRDPTLTKTFVRVYSGGATENHKTCNAHLV